MEFSLLEVAQMRSTIQILWHYAPESVKAAFLADDDNPENLVAMIDNKIGEYAEEIHKAVNRFKEA